MIKYFRFSYDFVLWEIGYANLNMLMATIPDIGTGEEKEVEVDSTSDLKNYLGL